MKQQTRRRFLLSSLSAGAGLASIGGLDPLLRLAHASEGAASVGDKHRYFIFCYFGGGWDVLVTLDPRDPAVFSKSAIPAIMKTPATLTSTRGATTPTGWRKSTTKTTNIASMHSPSMRRRSETIRA